MLMLEELYYGNVNPHSDDLSERAEAAGFAGCIAENTEKLTAFLNRIPNAEEERHLFSQLTNARNSILEFTDRERFMEGFRLGAQLMFETCAGNDSDYNHPLY